MSYLDENEWGEELAYDAITEDYPDLRGDTDFQDYWDEMFAEDMNWDEAHDAFDQLNDYLRDEYGLDVNDYFNWNDWRIEHMDS